MSLSSEAREKLQEAFHLYDTNADGFIEIEQLGTLLRACGKSPTNAEVREYEKEVGKPQFDFNTFLQVYEKAKSYTREEIYKCFKVFDKDGTGKVSRAHLVNVLVNVGEKLSREEVEKILEGVTVTDGYIDYKEFVDKRLVPNA
jgi:calmodulin